MERDREQARLVAWQVATAINLHSTTTTSVAELLGELPPSGVVGDGPSAQLAEADELEARRDESLRMAALGWADDASGAQDAAFTAADLNACCDDEEDA